MARFLWEAQMETCTLLGFLPLLPLHQFPIPAVRPDGPARISVTLPLRDRKTFQVVPGVCRPVVQALAVPPTSSASLLKTLMAIRKSAPRLYHSRQQRARPRRG